MIHRCLAFFYIFSSLCQVDTVDCGCYYPVAGEIGLIDERGSGAT